jgi:uncharacterized protein
MIAKTFLSALALVFVIEGILPFLSPRALRSTLQHLCAQSDTAIRVIGFCSMLAGVGILYWIRLSVGE